MAVSRLSVAVAPAGQAWRWVIPAGLLTALFFWGYTQRAATYSYDRLNPAMDALQYLRQYDYFSGLSPRYQVTFPRNGRVLPAWVAARMGAGDGVLDFQRANALWLCGFAMVLASAWYRLRLRLSVALLGAGWFWLHWRSPLRLHLADPPNADLPGYFWQSLWLALLLFPVRRLWAQVSLLAGIAVCGTLSKESFIVVVGATALWLWLYQRKTSPITSIRTRPGQPEPGISWTVCLGLLAVTVLVQTIAGQAFPAERVGWRSQSVVSVGRVLVWHLRRPAQWPLLPLAWVWGYGGLTIAALLTGINRLIRPETTGFHMRPICPVGLFWPRPVRACLVWPGGYLLWMSGTWLILSVIGGGDTTRLFVNGAPFVLTACLLLLNRQPGWWLLVVAVISLPTMRPGEFEPDLGRFPQQVSQWGAEAWLSGHWVLAWSYIAFSCVVFALSRFVR